MKSLPTGMQELLDGGATTFCYCWKVTRRDGTVMGFTEHDVPLTFDGVTYQAESGFTSSTIQQSLGLSVDNIELASAFNSDFITETDLLSGVYDDAKVEIFWVNWKDLNHRVLSLVGNIGEVKQEGIKYVAELRSLTHRLNQKIGRIYSRDSDRDGLDISSQITGTVTVVHSNNSFEFTTTQVESDYYNRGVVAWTSGNNQNAEFDVKKYSVSGSEATVYFWDNTIGQIQVGDSFTITSAWPRTAKEHKARYGNLIDFRGFPHMPGKDMVTDYAQQGAANQDGSARVI